MRNKKRDPKWWVILALLNVLLIGYPAALYLQADDGASRVMALTLIGVGFLLAIANVFTVVATLAE